ncbi:hypothetical protein ACFCX4_25965 [Kitasatospora sp. NPDC056327]
MNEPARRTVVPTRTPDATPHHTPDTPNPLRRPTRPGGTAGRRDTAWAAV